MDWLLDPLQHRFAARALVVALLLGVSGGLVGCVLLLRRLALLADAFGHALLPGVGLAYLLAGPSLPALAGGACVAGLLTASASALVARGTRLKEDAAFGALFVICFAAGAALLGKVAAPTDLLHYLFGHVLGLTRADLILAAMVSAGTVLAVALFQRPLVLDCFDQAFHRASGGRSALTHLLVLGLVVVNLVAALQAVGMVLSLGLFLLPAATAYLWCERFTAMLWFSAVYGAVGAMGGFYLSYYADLNSGASMVLCLGSGFILSALFSPTHGLFGRRRQSHRHQREDSEDTCAVPTVPDPARSH